jgi:ribonuclease P protein component
VRRRGDGDARLGFSVGKKVGGAVVRNRVKRGLREACRHVLSVLRPGMDLVFVARAPMRDMDGSAVREAVMALLAKSGSMAGVRSLESSVEGEG